MKPLRLKKLNYISPLEKKGIVKLSLTGLYIAIALLLLTVLILKLGVN